ncbi:MAG: hypothetical protein JJD97_08025, partial [Gemmatimonadaceae bacterium]|nr:hypothetical protein [Gemmatimonadaceae bacterium]
MTSSLKRLAALGSIFALACAPAAQKQPAPAPAPAALAPAPDSSNADIEAMVSRLDVAHYRATVKGLTQFGDRRQGTARNRAAVDWIEAQLKSYGCTNTERITYD